MGALEGFLHDRPTRTPTLLKAAMAHVQFETIHPFLDGNGRVGRLIVTLLLCAERVLREPTLYLSLYLKKHRADYYDLLDRVRREGDWEAWVRFFADGVAETAEAAVRAIRDLLRIAEEDRTQIQALGRQAGSAARVHEALRRAPVCTIPRLAEMTGLSLPTVAKALDGLERLGMTREITGKKRHRVYSYERYLSVLSEGTEPL
jgi:Fic family protein